MTDASATTLTYEALLEAVEKIRNARRPPPCGTTAERPHYLHPKDYDRGHGMCGVCGQFVKATGRA